MSQSRRRNRWWTYPLVAYGVWCAVLYCAQDALIFPRHALPQPSAGLMDARQRIWKLSAPGGHVEARWCPHPGASAARPRPAVMIFHGNAELADGLTALVQDYRSLGMSVLLPEYRGYGRSAGRPSQAALVSDARQFAAKLAEQPEVDATKIVYHGRSLGSGVAAALADVEKPAALILVSAPANLSAFAWSYGVPPWLVRNPFRTDRVLPKLGCPVMLIHGTEDRVVPLRDGRRLHDLCPDSQLLELPAGHNDLPRAAQHEEFRLAIRGFLKRARVLND